MENIKYANAFSEVLEILEYVSEKDYEKIPIDLIKVFEENCNKEYIFSYNPELSLTEQKVSSEAKTIIAILFRDYWATDKQREKIKLKEKYDLEQLEKEKKEKYNSDNIFKDRQIKEEMSRKSLLEKQNTQLVEYKESKLRKLMNIILKIFNSNKK